jgi:hypothetical protein
MDGQSFLLPFVAAMAGGGRLLDMKKAPTGVGAQFSQPRQNLPDPAREKLRLSETRSSTIHEGRPERRAQAPPAQAVSRADPVSFRVPNWRSHRCS